MTIFGAQNLKLSMTLAQQQYLELLRAGLWNKPADQSLFQGEVDWKAILRTSHQQTTNIIVADGIDTLPASLCPPKPRIFKLAIKRTENTLMHQLLNKTINQVVQALNAEGIPSVLLKGQGVAQNYRNPESRMCGDIDLYVGRENFLKAYDILGTIEGIKMPETSECSSHILAELGEVVIELHHKTCVLYGRKTDTSWQEWTRANLDSKMRTGQLPAYYNNGELIEIPDPTYNALYILMHAVRHLISEGIGFRHVSDWTMFLYCHHDKVDRELLAQKLQEYRMEAVWKEFAVLVHTHLGLPKEYIPLYPAAHASRTDILASHIFDSGNFGRSSDKKRSHDKSYVKRKWRNFCFQTSRLIKIFSLFPLITISHGWSWFTSALLRFARKK